MTVVSVKRGRVEFDGTNNNVPNGGRSVESIMGKWGNASVIVEAEAGPLQGFPGSMV